MVIWFSNPKLPNFALGDKKGLSSCDDIFISYHHIRPLPKTGGWKDWFLWQYTSKGKIPGVNVHLDLSWFNGSEEDFRRWTKGEMPAMSDVERLEQAIVNLCVILGVDPKLIL